MAGRKLFRSDMMVLSMVLVLASRSLITTVAQGDLPTLDLGEGCSPDTYKYVNKTAFEDNLNTVFSSLASNISSSNASFFATNVSNKGDTDEVHALILCRKYLTSNECLECFTAAKNRLEEFCSNKGYNGGRIQLDGCLLRYENNTFLERGPDAGNSTYCVSADATKPQEFNPVVKIFLSQLIANASKTDGYAVGVSSNASITVYGLVQCVPTLSEATCQQCLEAAESDVVNNCLPKQEGRGLQGPCFLRYATYSFYGNSTSTSTNTTRNSPIPSSNRNVKTLPILLGSIGGAAFLAAVCSVFICRGFFERFKRIGFRGRHLHNESERQLVAAETFEQVLFEYDVLRDATENFNNTNLIGKGGFGQVYMGKLVDGRAIAVKKLSERQSSTAVEDFLTEVKLISSVRHRNLVRLLGCCARGHERLLVYEFMSNNSLDKHLFGATRNHLDWETRFNIIVGTARGLAYLHEDSNIRIVHRDIKAANILLDDKFHPKIADFGLAKFFPEGETHVSTRVGGTRGYTAPEYAVHGQLSVKADVYSYGVLVLEIVSGRKCVNQNLPVPLQLLLEWAWRKYESEQALEIVDGRISEREYPRDQMLRVINIALLCCQASPVLRPTMSGVVLMLTTASEIDVRPTPPAFIDAGVTPSSSATPSSSSHGSITVSSLAR